MSNKALTWLSTAGKDILKVLGVITEVAAAAAPEVAIAAPQVAVLYSSTVGLAVAAEAALGSGTGQQKLAAVTSAVTQWANGNGWTGAEAEIQKWASAFADSLNLFPFKPVAAPVPPAPPAA